MWWFSKKFLVLHALRQQANYLSSVFYTGVLVLVLFSKIAIQKETNSKFVIYVDIDSFALHVYG